ncbi:DUF1521 domain-containing protein [Bradyrhizobium diazoefficiens]
MTLDELTSDGAQTIHESGQGWVDGAGRAVNQASIDDGEQGRGRATTSMQAERPPLRRPSSSSQSAPDEPSSKNM